MGSTVTFTAAGTGTNFTYQWQESVNGGTSYTNIINGGILFRSYYRQFKGLRV
ncbi:MAG: hypothetical protein WDM90_08955 [Ferruginibacter sp.]